MGFSSAVVLIISLINAALCDWSMTVSEFQKCASAKGKGSPSESIANAFINQAKTKGGITSKLEAFEAIAELAWESDGFTARSEYACSNGQWSAWPCDTYDTNGCPAGNKYYGRGFIQLTHCYNYRAAEPDFPGIVANPNLVATRDDYAMGTALWYWKNHVHGASGVSDGQYGAATRAINGGLECTPNGNTAVAKQRYTLLLNCLSSAGASSLGPKEGGCYDVAQPASTSKPATTTTPKPGQTTTTKKPSSSTGGTCRNNNGDSRYDTWCVENCNAVPSYCPDTICICS